jgi:molybdopterin converting factor small subunit
MEVTVKLKSLFEKYRDQVPNDKAFLPEGSTVLDLAKQIGLPTEYLRIILVNGKQEGLDKVLSDGDLIFIFPPAIGGG